MKKVTSKCVKSNTKLKIYFIETFVEAGNTKLKVTQNVLLLTSFSVGFFIKKSGTLFFDGCVD